MRKKLKEYDILRALLVVLVVFGHSFYNVLSYGAMNLNYGYTAYHSFWNVLWNIHHIVYSFHMQAFFALSGAVFYLSGGSNHTMDQVIGKKAKKLLVPFFACAYFYMLPVKLIGGGVSIQLYRTGSGWDILCERRCRPFMVPAYIIY